MHNCTGRWRWIWSCTFNFKTFGCTIFILRSGESMWYQMTKIVPAGTLHSCGVVIGADIYMFGGGGVWDYAVGMRNCTNALWKLTRPSKHYFEWSEIVTQPQAKAPSPRYSHSGWEYAGKLWIFGGIGLPLAGYLNDHGDFKVDVRNRNLYGENNQLLCCNPSSGVWRNPNTSGTIPRQCHSHATTIIGEKVWVYGGRNLDYTFEIQDLFQLNMISLTWTKIKTDEPQPPYRWSCSWNAVTEHQLVLHGGVARNGYAVDDTWIFDLSSLSWRQYKPDIWCDNYLCSHTGTVGLKGTVMIVGGGNNFCPMDNDAIWEVYSHTFHLEIEPKSLRQQAMWIIHQHGDAISWNLLPTSLKKLTAYPVVDTVADE